MIEEVLTNEVELKNPTYLHNLIFSQFIERCLITEQCFAKNCYKLTLFG